MSKNNCVPIRKSSEHSLEQHSLLTVCVLSYNSAGFVKETLKSIWYATYPSIEVLCFDDGSTDGSDLVAEEACRRYGFQFIRNEVNQGIPKTCNKALSRAKGEFFTVIGDDIVTKYRYAHDVSLLSKEPDAVLITSAVTEFREKGYSFDADGPPDTVDAKVTQESLLSAWLVGSKIITPTVTFRTARLKSMGGFDEDLKFEDRPLYLELAVRRLPFLVSKSALTFYRRTRQSLSISLTPEVLRDEVKLFRKFKIWLPQGLLTVRLVVMIYTYMLVSGISISKVLVTIREAELDKLAGLIKSRTLRLLFLVLHANFSRTPNQPRHIRKFLSDSSHTE